MIRSINDLKVYIKSYKLAMEIFEITKRFPPEEKYSLTSQIRRSSRSVPGNTREGFAKRKYPQIFVRHLNDSLGSSEETRGWLLFSKDCGYIAAEEFKNLDLSYDEINAMLHGLMNKWEKYEVQEAETEYKY